MANAEALSPEAVPADATPVAKLAQRDVLIVLAALSLWAAADAWYATTGLWAAAALSALDGALVGVGVGLLLHEWGHFVGARLAGGIAPTRELKQIFPIFDFDMQHNGQGPFRAMSWGGNLAHWTWVALLALAVPLDTPGRTSLFAGALGLAVFASLTELPVIWRAYSGATPIESFKGLTGQKLRRNQGLGFAAGVAAFLII